MNYDLKLIKDKYGEEMMHLCRTLFPTLLEEEGLLFNLLSDNFAYSKFLYSDIVNNRLVEKFKDYIYGLVDVEIKQINVNKTPKELLDEAGYVLYECDNEEDIQSFKKYYAKNEELCTFDGGRLNRCYVFFAVKKNVDDIKRENFSNPKREDEYGTSVISIQFAKGDTNTLSIKNRYNHRVNNPDATYGNNLENIIHGLTKSFEKEYNLNIESNKNGFEIPGYVKASDGKYYKYNYEIRNICYCTDNIIVDNFEVIDKYSDKSRYILLDYFILDLKEKKLFLYDNSICDSFINEFINIDKISITKDKGYKYVDVKTKVGDIKITLDKKNNILKYSNPNLIEAGNYFLSYNKLLNEITVPNLKKTGDCFLCDNQEMESINLPNLKIAGNQFLNSNKVLNSVSIPNLKETGLNFLYHNLGLKEVSLPKLEKTGNNFLYFNRDIKDIYLPSLRKVGSCFLAHNQEMESINLPNLSKAGSDFIFYNRNASSVNIPNLEEVDDNFLFSNKLLSKIDLPNLKYIGWYFMHDNNLVTEISFPKLRSIDGTFLINAGNIISINLPSLEYAGDKFLYHNQNLQTLNAPKLESIGDYFLYNNKSLVSLNLPSVKEIESNFMYHNTSLKELNMPVVYLIGNSFLCDNKVLEKFNAPNIKEIGDSFLLCNENLQSINLPVVEQIGEYSLLFNEHICCDDVLMEAKNGKKIKSDKNR